jgi:hypothetical protein
LRRIGRRIGVFDGGPVRAHQGQEFSIPAELERGMQLGGGIRAVFPRSKDNQVTGGWQGDGRDRPPGEVSGAVRQVPSPKFDRDGIRIVQLKPVRGIAVLVRQGGVVNGQELIDQHARDGRNGCGKPHQAKGGRCSGWHPAHAYDRWFLLQFDIAAWIPRFARNFIPFQLVNTHHHILNRCLSVKVWQP